MKTMIRLIVVEYSIARTISMCQISMRKSHLTAMSFHIQFVHEQQVRLKKQ